MRPILYSTIVLTTASVLLLAGCSGAMGDQAMTEEEVACLALTGIRNLTITSAEIMEATDSSPRYCYVKGFISPAITYHVQLPLTGDWNGRFLQWGDR